MKKLITTVFMALLLSACYSQQPNYRPHPDIEPAIPPSSNARMCGGLMGATCENPNEYCQYSQAAQCGAADQSGVCSPRPQICTQEYAPVCGCDDRTYSSTCTAAGNSASVAYEGECRR